MRTLLFQDPGFPGYRFSCRLPGAKAVGARELAQALRDGADVLVNLHGEYFPEEAAEALVDFLSCGGGLVNLFAPPMQRMVAPDGRVGRRRLSWLRKLKIHAVYDVPLADSLAEGYQVNPDCPAAEVLLPFLPMEGCMAMCPTPTTTKYVDREWGSPGAMDLRVTPLIEGVDQEGVMGAAPVVCYEHQAGDFAGGRWVFVNQEVRPGCDVALAALAEFAAAGEQRVSVTPVFASYAEGEAVRLRVQAQSARKETSWQLCVRVRRDAQEMACLHLQVEGGRALFTEELALPGSFPPGQYTLETDCASDDGERRGLLQGFCVRDDALLSSLPPLRCEGEQFSLGEGWEPIVGSTYMSTSVSRAFLHQPNPGEWLRDMRRMRAQGIRWIRTGLWCHARSYMLEDGFVEERMLRAMDAYLQCAAAAGLHVTFNFFTFCPVDWEGSHPYLDRRALEAQKRFLLTLARRHRHTTHVDWDLMNEPYWSDHPQGRKPWDDLERQAFARAMKERYGDGFTMRDTLDLTTQEPEGMTLPTREQINFDVLDVDSGKIGLIWQDYLRFTQETFRGWVREMAGCLKAVNPDWLVVFGQDEALPGRRPCPINYRHELDYGAIHSWSGVDTIAWNIMFSKVWGVPHLAQETGLFYTENPDGFPRYTERESMQLMQRKLAYAYGLGCAGVLQWLWNTNIYLRSANEAHIGACRADGSMKIEGRLFKRFARMFEAAAGRFDAHQEVPEIAVVYPFSNDFSNRAFAQRATQMACDVLLYELCQGFVPVSEYDLEVLREARPRLIIVPSPESMEQQAAETLLKMAEEIGAAVLWTGPMGLDEHFQQVPDGDEGMIRPLRRYETLRLDDDNWVQRFDGGLASTAFAQDTGSGLRRKSLGEGYLLHTGIPVELGVRMEPVAALYRHAMEIAGVRRALEVEGGEGMFVHVLRWSRASLYTIMNESGDGRKAMLRDPRHGGCYEVSLPRGESEMWIADEKGSMISWLNGMVRKV